MSYKNPFLPPVGVEYKKVPEAAKILQLDEATIYRYIRQGILQSIKLGGSRRVLFSTSTGHGIESDKNYSEIIRRAEGGV